MERMSRLEYHEIENTPKRSKYGAKRTLVDGIAFDSKAEASYYGSLKMRAKAGEVENIELQRSFDLIVNGVKIARYRADFVFWDVPLRRRRIIDVKGVETPAFKLKRKLMKACHGLEIEVVK